MPVIFPATAESYIPSSLTLLSSKVTLCHFNMSSLTLLSSPEISDSRLATLLFRRLSANFKIENCHSRTPNSAQPMMLLPPRIPSVQWASIARVAPSNTRYFILVAFFFLNFLKKYNERAHVLISKKKSKKNWKFGFEHSLDDYAPKARCNLWFSPNLSSEVFLANREIVAFLWLLRSSCT